MLSRVRDPIYLLYVDLLRVFITLAVVASVLVSLDRLHSVYRYCRIAAVKRWTGRRPEERFKFAALPDLVRHPLAFPKLAVQLPMFNERAVCQAVIDSACELSWPHSRLTVQVLDDSTDKTTAELVDDKVLEWKERGISIHCLRRSNRQGYKAGALREGLARLTDVEFVAIFDADFKPDPSFLLATVPYLMHNPEVGFVQARWTFTNPEESLLTKAQELSLNFHCKCEQYTHFASGGFFNFNGTAGVWRRKTIEQVGGWNSRTTVEDMDLSLRTFVGGWKAIYLTDITCLNELWRRAAIDIWASKLHLVHKLELVLCYFGIRKFATHWVSLGFFCMLVPLSMFTPEINIPLWALVHLPLVVTATTALFTPYGWLHSILYVLFENAMGVVKLGAVIAGLLDLKQAQEWVVTQKLGSSDKRPAALPPAAPLRVCRLYAGELVMSIFVLGAALYGVVHVHRWHFSLFLGLQGLVFLAFALNLVDCGNLLGGRLDSARNAVSASKAAKTAANSAGKKGMTRAFYVV